MQSECLVSALRWEGESSAVQNMTSISAVCSGTFRDKAGPARWCARFKNVLHQGSSVCELLSSFIRKRIEQRPFPLTEHSFGALAEHAIPKRSDSCSRSQLPKKVVDRDEVVCAWMNFVAEIGFSCDKLVSCRVRG